MVVSCSACGEQYGVTEDVTFHKFPANEERRNKWLDAVQREAWTPGKRSMLCSKHFSPDKFVYKVSGDKVRRYLMPDTVPTIFDRTDKKSRSPASLHSNQRIETLSSNVNGSTNVMAVEPELGQSDADAQAGQLACNSSPNLNLEILASTSVTLEPYMIVTKPQFIQVDKNTPYILSKSTEVPATTSVITASTTFNTSAHKVLSQPNGQLHFPRPAKRVYNMESIQTDLTSIPKQPRLVYPGDFKQLNSNNVKQDSKNWIALNNYIKKMRRNMKVLQQRNRRLEKRVTDLKTVVKFLKNRIVTRDSAAIRLCGHSDLPEKKECLPKNHSNQVAHFLGDHDYVASKNWSIL
ncbi:uncharacterized protein LOC107223765 isoform X1 [Neodiprion lecontei]|uniref:Uncharacterized protein LOC107223765 isoform X1 n=1 Tax=Neodiprion lecontei TaxID=441921 RepID=A0A6J0BXQ5_NEOLC|nr:uncharacterized protein LOC107223765 isoform X1 [Neodiprion lecontei]